MLEKLREMDIKKKLNTGYNIVIVLMIVSSVISMVALGILNHSLNDFAERVNVADTAVKICRIDINIAARNVREMALNTDVSKYPEYVATINAKLASVDEQLSILEQTGVADSNTVNEYKTDIAVWRKDAEEIIKELQNGNRAKATKMILELCAPALTEVVEVAALLDEDTDIAIKAKLQQSMMVFIAGLVAIVLFVLVATIASKKIGAAIIGAIITPVQQIEKAAVGLRSGDLSGSKLITFESEDELGHLAMIMKESLEILDGYIDNIVENFEKVANADLTRDFNEIPDYLGDFGSIKHSFVVILKEYNDTLNKIRETAVQVDKGSDELAGASNELASGTSEQVSAVEELTATIEMVSQMAEDAAVQANHAYESMMNSVNEALNERRQMQELQKEMEHIKEISNEIEAIVTAIEEIASQTSLLALNASIEAARAGEAGRGFAVVADQIGKLATDSAKAVITTKELIGKTIEEIDNGNKITETTALGFENIIKEMEAIADLSKANNEVSKAQSQALSEVEAGINQISMVTQQNAAASEECSAISEELAARAAELEDMVSRFKLYSK